MHICCTVYDSAEKTHLFQRISVVHLIKTVVFRVMEGPVKPGRPRREWLDDVQECMCNMDIYKESVLIALWSILTILGDVICDAINKHDIQFENEDIVHAFTHGLWTMQPYAAPVCSIIVFIPVTHAITLITTHLPIPEGWKAELADS